MRLGSRIYIFFSTVIAPLCILSLSSCTGHPNGLRKQTLTFEWQGESYSHTYLCAPTRFPEFRSGSISLDSGSTPSIRRGVEMGWSPIPQWAVISQGSKKFAVKLVCEGQWIGARQAENKTVVERIEVFLLRENRNGLVVRGHIPVARSVTPPIRVKDFEAAGQKVTADIQALFPLSGFLQAFPKAGSIPTPVTSRELFLHADSRTSYARALDRDPFLETEFFKSNIADPLAMFTASEIHAEENRRIEHR